MTRIASIHASRPSRQLYWGSFASRSLTIVEIGETGLIISQLEV